MSSARERDRGKEGNVSDKRFNTVAAVVANCTLARRALHHGAAEQWNTRGGLFDEEVHMNLKHGLCGSILGAAVVVGGVAGLAGCDRDPPKATTDKPVPP